MFKIISQHEHLFNKDLVDPFIRELKTQNLALFESLSDLKNASFILAKSKPGKINGGAVLIKKEAKDLHPLLQDNLKTFLLPDQEVWIGTFALELNGAISGQDYTCFSKIFFGKLYESLMVFGKQEKESFVCLTLPSAEFLTTDRITNWPYLFTINPRKARDGYYHTVLALNGLRPESSEFSESIGQTWKTINGSSRNGGLAA